ncbi:Alstrom syndrome protein 1 isoform X2 [Xenopus laevis]|nr:Alstrom syndrome protein 1 isoform X2 [Xenopus laevis]
MESWYQLPAEEDASNFMPPFSETGAFANQTEFPTVEEGTLHSEPDETKGQALGLMHSLQFETQDSQLSPCLPLLISTSTQGHKLFDETLYQQSELEFAPLSGSLDISEFPGQTSKLLLISDALTLAAKEVSEDVADVTQTQNPLPFSTEGDHDSTSLHYLSQHPLPSSLEDVDFVQWSHTISESTKSEGLQAAAYNKQTAPPLQNLDMVFSQEDGSFLDSSVPAPVLLELLEKEVGVSGSSEVSSTSSSTENISNKMAGFRYTHQDLHLGEQIYSDSQPQRLAGSGKISEQYLLEGETFQDSSEIDFNMETLKDGESLHPNTNRSHPSGITVRLSNGPPPVLGKDLHKQLCTEIQQRYKERMLLKSSEGLNEKGATHDISSVTEASTDPNSGRDDTVVEVLSSVARNEMTISSRCSIERGHKDSEISPIVNPTAVDSSFIGRLAYPISQSTPGTFTGKTGRNQLTGRLMQIKAKLTGSNMSLNEEPPSNTPTAPVSTKPQSLQSSRGYAESSDSQTSLSPDRRRIQSLPSLNYIEKVGAWNTNQSFDALVLRGLTGISPKKKAFNAVADSLNHILSKQSGSALPKSRLSALSRATGSMNNLTATETEASGNPQLIRSQSCTSVPMGRADTDIQDKSVTPVTEGSDRLAESHDAQTVGSHSDEVVPLDYTSPEQPVDYKEATEKASSGQKSTSQTQQPKGDVGGSLVAMDRFSDVSSNNEFLTSSGSSGRTNQMHSLTSLELDNFVPLWPPPVKTPEEVKEINIEERIPTYLRNLGIDQSPSTILTPFALKGPIREPEFSPSDLRTIKGSTATPNRSMRFSEGGSQSAADISQSSVYSTASTTSVSIPMASDTGQDSPLLFVEMFSQFSSRSTGDRPVSQCDMTTRFGEDNETLQCGLKSKDVATGIVASEFQSVEIPAAPPLSMELQGDMENPEALNRVKQLIGHFECKTISPDRHVSNTSDIEAADFFGMAPVSVTPLQKPASADSFGSASVSGIPLQIPALDDSYGLVAVSGIPLQKPTSADSIGSVSGIPLQKPALEDSFGTVSITGIPLQKPTSADSFGSVSGNPLQKSALEDSFGMASVSGIPLQKLALADAYGSLSVSGILLQKPASADSFSSASVSGFPLQKLALDDSYESVSVSGIPLQKLTSADSFCSVSQIPLQKAASAVSFNFESISGFPVQKPALDCVNDSFVGAKTLKEIRKLLAEADTVGLDELGHSYSLSSQVKGIPGSSSSMWLKSDDSIAPSEVDTRFTSLGHGRVPEISWDTSLRSSLKSDKDSPVNVGWDDSLASIDQFKDSIDLENKLEGQNQPIAQLKQERLFERSEPEGFSEVMNVNKGQLYPPLHNGSSGATEGTSGLLRNVTSVVGGLEKALAKTALSYGRAKEEVTESDDSSADSLAGRVKSLLKKDSSLMNKTRTGTRTDGNETRTRASVQLKLANRSSIAETILNEEDRRRIEEIKRELMEGAKESQLGQNAFHADGMASDHWLKSEPFLLHLTPSPDLSQSNQRTQPEVMEGAPESLAPLTTPGTLYKVNGETSGNEECQRLGEPCVPPLLQLSDLGPREAAAAQRELSQQGAPQSSWEFSKPVTSITFSSRKRSSPLSLSSSSERGYPTEIPPVGTDPQKLIPSAAAKSLCVPDNCTPVLDAQNTAVPQLQHRHYQHTPDSSQCAHHGQSTDNESSPALPSTPRLHDVPLVVSIDQSSHSVQADGQRSDTEGNEERVRSSAEPFISAASSPAKKAISCVHVQISPKRENYKELHFGPKLLTSSACVNDLANDKLQAEEPDLSASCATNLQGKEGTLIKQEHADEELKFSSPQFHPKPGGSCTTRPIASTLTTPESAAPVQFSRIPLHDATTQITTESPAKTTFSAEIFIDSREKEIISRSSDATASTTPERQPPYSARLSPATDQPLLVPYRPHGSPELFYVPYTDGLSRISPVSTIESSHTGSNDAVSPKFPAEVLGSGTDSLSDSAMVLHREGIYSKGSSPKLAWKQRTASHTANALETSPTRPTMRHALEQDPEHQTDSFTALTQRDLSFELNSRLDHQRESQTEENEFFSLKPEIDLSREQRYDMNSPAESSMLRKAKSISAPFTKSFQSPEVTGRRPQRGQVSLYSLDGSSVTDNGEHSLTRARYMSVTQESYDHKHLHKSQPNVNQSDDSEQSLDDLWARYTNRKKLEQSETKSNHELSLVERLDRLARLIHNSSSHSLLSAKDEPLADLEQNKNRVKERSWEGSGKKGERWYDMKLSGTDPRVREGYSLNEMEDSNSADETSVGSGFYPLLRSAKSDSASYQTETATQTGSEVTSQTSESSSVATLNTVSSSVSTIDTVRLINAFGPERVVPSSRLSRLYNAIDHQKRRSEESTGKHSRNSATRTDTGELHRNVYKTPDSASSVSTSDNSWQPRPVLKNKRNNKYVNKGVQAGNLEIVTSATKRKTRDVGTVFPSPRWDPHEPRSQGHIEKEERSWGSNVFTKRVGSTRQGTAQGLSWFVPAENLKSDPRKENRSDIKKAPSVRWYEPVTDAKPWREPLREKNTEERFLKRVGGQLNGSRLDPPENKALRPFAKVTLQESLETHRPDFIFRSGERVKRLHLLSEERKLQTVFHSEREKLFNQPAKAGEWETQQQQLQDYRLNQKNRMIPKKEMVQHAKRIYEQLPEVKKRREEEKRRREYQSYRLKAQLFQKKVTNHVLGRKTPWN